MGQPMLFQSSCKDVNVRIEVTGSNFDGTTGKERRRAFQGLVQFAVALAGSKKLALAILKSEMVNAFSVCLARMKEIEKEEKGFLEGPDSTKDSREESGEGEEGWPED